ncbi:hypothetical protein PCANC_17124 [Puccinia coronata f. sp. avenae]|uniref:Uncharacterized protein n=1 Tax=Puccinia coronata f. sp. avenae TaxID=200324 RepID=A0A2N5U1C2_9BASI|nr:hypothetical protein PCANC_17124 [Puccinia coronata f. sp. avenae]
MLLIQALLALQLLHFHGVWSIPYSPSSSCVKRHVPDVSGGARSQWLRKRGENMVVHAIVEEERAANADAESLLGLQDTKLANKHKKDENQAKSGIKNGSEMKKNFSSHGQGGSEKGSNSGSDQERSEKGSDSGSDHEGSEEGSDSSSESSHSGEYPKRSEGGAENRDSSDPTSENPQKSRLQQLKSFLHDLLERMRAVWKSLMQKISKKSQETPSLNAGKEEGEIQPNINDSMGESVKTPDADPHEPKEDEELTKEGSVAHDHNTVIPQHRQHEPSKVSQNKLWNELKLNGKQGEDLEDLHTVTDEQTLIILLQHTFERCKSSEKHMKEVTRILEEQEEKGRETECISMPQSSDFILI